MKRPSNGLGIAWLLLVTACSGGERSSQAASGRDASVGVGQNDRDGGVDDAGRDGSAVAHEDASDGSAGPDRDGDGLSDADELRYGTDPDNPDSDGDGLSDGEEILFGSDPLNPDTDGDGWTDKEERFLGTDPNGAGGGCASSSAEAVSQSRPVDVILIVDNSGSMDGEIRAVVDRINEDFAKVLAMSRVDYRLILLSRHGAINHDSGNSCDDHGVCIEPPLASDACEPNQAPKMTERFKHYSVCIDSRDGLQKAIDSFDGTRPSQYFTGPSSLVDVPDSNGGWSQWLRDGAFRTFLVITDDGNNLSADAFTKWIYEQDARYFGTEDAPNWVFHSIIGLKENTPPTAPYAPDDPFIDAKCSGAPSYGTTYQNLSISTGGLRFPVCKNDDFDAIFQTIATSVIERVRLSCRFAPQSNDNGNADFGRALVLYESGAGERIVLGQVRGPSDCADHTFYVEDETIHLCPSTCSTVEADLEGKLKTMVACYEKETCGNGRLDAGEACDDGNRNDGDGCDSECRHEGVILF